MRTRCVVDADPRAAAADLDEVLFQRLEVAVAQRLRVAQQVAAVPPAPRTSSCPPNGKSQFVVVEDVEDHHVVPPVPEHLQPLEERLAVAQQVGEDRRPGRGWACSRRPAA